MFDNRSSTRVTQKSELNCGTMHCLTNCFYHVNCDVPPQSFEFLSTVLLSQQKVVLCCRHNLRIRRLLWYKLSRCFLIRKSYCIPCHLYTGGDHHCHDSTGAVLTMQRKTIALELNEKLACVILGSMFGT